MIVFMAELLYLGMNADAFSTKIIYIEFWEFENTEPLYTLITHHVFKAHNFRP